MADSSMGSSYRNGIVALSFFVFIGGALILGTALWTLITISGFQTILGTSAGIFASVYLMIGVGSLMLLISFFGCLGAFLESKYMLSFYGVLLFLIFLIELVGSVLAFVYYPVAREAAQRSIRLYEDNEVVQEGWNDIQGVLECCGIENYNDWRQLGALFPRLPSSCCSDIVDTCEENSRTRWTEGCDPKVEAFFAIIGGIGFGILLVELLTIAVIGCGLRRMFG